jgi:acetyl esterase
MIGNIFNLYVLACLASVTATSAGEESGYLPVALPRQGVPGKQLTTQFTYRKAGDVDLQMKVWYPPGWQQGGQPLPAVVFFFGGGWSTGDINQFNGIGPYLAKRGMIVLAPEYRTTRDDGVEVEVCLQDAKSAMRYVYKNADALGVDPAKIAAGGRSAGGHLAAAAAFARGFDAPGDDLSLNCKPAALVLFNPVIDNGPGSFRHDVVRYFWEDFSPLHTISKDPPPTIFFTGDKDQHTPIETAQQYKAAMEKQGGRCELVVFEGGVHGSPFAKEFYQRTLDEMDRFLVDLGYLPATD